MKKNWILISTLAIIITSCNNKQVEVDENLKDTLQVQSNHQIAQDSVKVIETADEKVAETPENQNLEIKNEDFKSYINSLGSVNLPFKYVDDAQNNLPEFSKKYNKKLFNKFKAENTDLPIGIYEITPNYIAVLEVANSMVTVPVLNTYDENGKIISSELIYNFNESEPGYIVNNVVTFDTNTIKVDRTITIFEIDEDTYQEIPGTVKKTKEQDTFTINTDGKINKK